MISMKYNAQTIVANTALSGSKKYYWSYTRRYDFCSRSNKYYNHKMKRMTKSPKYYFSYSGINLATKMRILNECLND